MRMLKRVIVPVVILIFIMNVVGFLHAYKFTHFSDDNKTRTDPKELTFFGKLETLAFGVDNPRPFNTNKPARPYKTLVIPHERDTIQCWYVPVESSKGTVLIFHGYAGNKSQMVKESDQFNDLGYTTIVVDFLGSGGSTGNRTTIGYYEADQVKAVFDFAKRNDHERIIMFGTSMGAVAIMKSIHDHNLEPESIILECPFGDMLETVQARFRIMKAPVFPMSYLLTFWGGAQNGFDAFSHDPIDYVEEISVNSFGSLLTFFSVLK